jgi:hypothetical protein
MSVMPMQLPCLCVLLLCVACAAARADEPARPAQASDLVRVFRFHAAAQAEALGEAVERASFDPNLKDALRQLVRAHLARVDEEAGKVGSGTPSGAPSDRPLDEVLDRADKLARDFNDRDVADWLDAHPAAYQPVQEQIALAEAGGRAVASEPEALVRAAVVAGAGKSAEAELRTTVTAAHDRLKRENDAAEKRLNEAGAKLPRPPAPPKGAAGEPPKEPPEVAPSPEVRAVQLLDAVTEVEAHARGVAAWREVRDRLDKLLPEPGQRKTFHDEMLHWLQDQAPPEPAGKDAAPREGAPPQRRPDPRDSIPPSAAPNPGF